MTPRQIISQLQDKFPGKIPAAFPDDKHPRIHLDASNWREIAQYLLNDPALRMDWLACLSGVDYPADDQLGLVYELWSFEHRHRLAVKVFCSRDNAAVASVADLWPAANWHEREAFDLFGIVFTGHPDLRRIFSAAGCDE